MIYRFNDIYDFVTKGNRKYITMILLLIIAWLLLKLLMMLVTRGLVRKKLKRIENEDEGRPGVKAINFYERKRCKKYLLRIFAARGYMDVLTGILYIELKKDSSSIVSDKFIDRWTELFPSVKMYCREHSVLYHCSGNIERMLEGAQNKTKKKEELLKELYDIVISEAVEGDQLDKMQHCSSILQGDNNLDRYLRAYKTEKELIDISRSGNLTRLIIHFRENLRTYPLETLPVDFLVKWQMQFALAEMNCSSEDLLFPVRIEIGKVLREDTGKQKHAKEIFNKLDQIITQSVLSYSSIKVITKFLKELEEPNNTLMRAVVDSKNMMSVRFLMKNIDQPLARNSIRTMIQDSNDVNWKHLNSDYGSLLEKVKDLLGILYDKATNEESYATFANKEKSAADICDLVDRIIQRNYLVFRIPATISNELNFENVTRLMEYSECGHVRKAGYKILGLYHTDQALRAAEAGMKDPNWIVSDAAGDTSRQIRKNIEYEFNLYNSRNDRSLQEGVDDANEDIRLFVLHKMLHLLRQGICFEDKSLKMSLEALTAIDKSISIQAITKKILYLNNNVK